jgi:hypothetical protein
MKASIVHDEFGEIKSVSHFEKGVKAFVLAGANHSVLIADHPEKEIQNLIRTHRVDLERQSLAPVTGKKQA